MHTVAVIPIVHFKGRPIGKLKPVKALLQQPSLHCRSSEIIGI